MSRTLALWRSLPSTSRLGFSIVAALILLALFGPLLAPYDPIERVTTPFAPPSSAHLLGADDVGHDLLSVLILGARPSLLVALLAAIAATCIGMLVGITAGYLRGAVDTVLMRIVDVVLALPVVPLTLVVGVLAGPGLLTQTLVISIALWAPMARELRAQVLSVRERDHVHALRAMGAGHGYMLTRHIVPAVGTLVVPQLVLAVKSAVMLEATLAFLGLGDVSSMSWGMMLSIANERSAFLTDAWLWWVVPPGALIGLTVLGFALAGGAVERTAAGRTVRTARRRKPAPASAASTVLAQTALASASPATQSQSTAPEAPLLEVDQLTVRYGDGEAATGGCTGVDLVLPRGRVLGLVGESGSGKSTVAAALVGLMAPAAQVIEGGIRMDGTDLLALGPRERRGLLGSRIGLVPQEAQSALNPVHRAGDQIAEAVLTHQDLTREQARARAQELLDLVGLPAHAFRSYPHQLSGGQRQRVVIATALANDPDLLVADEPTSGLDVLVQQDILDLLSSLRDRLGLTMVIVTHDLPVIAHLADDIAVMRAGFVVEQGETLRVLASPDDPYTRRLVGSLPDLAEFEEVR